MPLAASGLLRDLGLAGFVAVVGLQSGLQAVETVRQNGSSAPPPLPSVSGTEPIRSTSRPISKPKERPRP
jgi:hypothetical protein